MIGKLRKNILFMNIVPLFVQIPCKTKIFIFCIYIEISWEKKHTLESWYQNICPGGSGPNRIVHVRLMSLPLSTNRSDPPKIVATGSE